MRVSAYFWRSRRIAPEALQIVSDSFVSDQSDRVAAFAPAQHLPTFTSNADLAQDGVLLSYGPSASELYRAAYYVKRILGGANADDLPVELATRIRLVVNLKTANALGLTVPANLVAHADEVIE